MHACNFACLNLRVRVSTHVGTQTGQPAPAQSGWVLGGLAAIKAPPSNGSFGDWQSSWLTAIEHAGVVSLAESWDIWNSRHIGHSHLDCGCFLRGSQYRAMAASQMGDSLEDFLMQAIWNLIQPCEADPGLVVLVPSVTMAHCNGFSADVLL